MEYVWAVLRLAILGTGLWLLIEVGSWYTVIGIAIFVALLVLVFFIKALFDAAQLPHEELEKRVSERKEAKRMKKTAARETAKGRKKKRGPIGGSHTAEIMMFGDDPVNRWAARKVRDKFF